MIRFGSLVPQGTRHVFAGWEKPGKEFDAIKSVALECEGLGYDSVWLYDHFITYPEVTNESCFESWTTLSALASITKKLGLGTMVTCNSYRYPSVLAKMSATLDAISNGRLNLGIGAGWYGLEYNAYGISFPKASVRIAQLGEAVQKPHPPILIGGRGRKLTLRITAKFADRCNFGGYPQSRNTRKSSAC